MIEKLAVRVLSLLALALPALGQSTCPHTKASNVPGSVQSSGPAQRCKLGIVLFGLHLEILGPDCQPFRFLYPAHGECQGASGDNTECVPAGLLPVGLESCRCASTSIFGITLLMPWCTCTSAGTGGTIEHAVTEACVPQEI